MNTTTNHQPETEASSNGPARGQKPGRPRSRGRVLASVGLLSAVVIAASGMAIARPFGGGGGPGMGFAGLHLFRIIRDLDLTEEQEVLAVRARRAISDEHAALRAETAKDTQALVDELAKPAPDAGAVHAILDRRIQAFTKVAHSAVDKFLEFHRTLSDAQRSTLVEEARQIPARMQDGRGGRRDGRGRFGLDGKAAGGAAERPGLGR